MILPTVRGLALSSVRSFCLILERCDLGKGRKATNAAQEAWEPEIVYAFLEIGIASGRAMTFLWIVIILS